MRGLAAALAIAIAMPAAAAVDVASRATGGAGTAANPWTGWDTSIDWAADTEYLFRSGYFAYSRSPALAKRGLALVGEAGATLQFRGEGEALDFQATPPVDGVRIENLIVQGLASAHRGVFLKGVLNPTLRHVSVRDVALAGVWAEGAIAGLMENVRVTHHEMPDDRFAVVPEYGIVLAGRSGNLTIVNPVVEGTGKAGLWIQAGSESNTVINGTSEGNRGKGMVIDGSFNTVINTDFEQNDTTIDVEISGDGNELRAAFTDQTVDVKAGRSNRIRGRFHRIRIAPASAFTDVSGAYMSGPLEDSSVTTIRYGYQTRDGLQRGLRPGRGP